ncbi:probable iron binding protein from the HesB_IscA_SufA family [hydrothermal vent metagenome]|uniref:Probable iron binding protein from the HesB_IscA_SufA family n=1 Tax=hydrothermal vent metagenome TaxID=652676 RepID=A0A3B0T8Z5_9ZZZZ
MLTDDDATRKAIPIALNTELQPAMLTSAAAAKVGELVAAEGDPDLGLRLSVRPGGCSGFTYEMYFDSKVDETDVVTETDGVKLIVDRTSTIKLAGSTVDFKDGGLEGAGFAINNPNEQRSCGCGKSFG